MARRVILVPEGKLIIKTRFRRVKLGIQTLSGQDAELWFSERKARDVALALLEAADASESASGNEL